MRTVGTPPPAIREAAAGLLRPYAPGLEGDVLWAAVRAHGAPRLPEVPRPPRALTPPAFADALGVSPRTLRNWTRAGKVCAVRLSRRCVRYPESELARLLAVKGETTT